MKFKVGDKVRVIESIDGNEGLGLIGTIGKSSKKDTITLVFGKVDENDYPEDFLYLDADGIYGEIGDYVSNGYFFEDQLEIAMYKYTRLAEKMFPDGYKEGDWWILK